MFLFLIERFDYIGLFRIRLRGYFLFLFFLRLLVLVLGDVMFRMSLMEYEESVEFVFIDDICVIEFVDIA